MRKNFLFVVLILLCLLIGCKQEEKHEHTLGAYIYDATGHWQECSSCGEKVAVEQHEMHSSIMLEATHTIEGTSKNTCSICEYQFESVVEKITEHTFDQQVVNDEYLKDKETCISATTYYYSCACGEKGEETFSVGKIKGHSFSAYVFNDNNVCSSSRTKIRTCSKCGTKETKKVTGLKVIHEIIDGECVNCHLKSTDVTDMVLVDLNVTDSVIENHAALYYSETLKQYFHKELSYEELNIPIIDINGTIEKATKTNTVNITFTYKDNTNEYANIMGTVKVQGSSSAYYPKKNYTLKLDSKIVLDSTWGKQKKYCLKANYIDFSQARNIVSANTYGDMVKDWGLSDEYNELVNGGAIDGYPVIIYSNGSFHGLYTLNIPKDKWLFGMKNTDNKNQAIIMADMLTNGTKLNEAMAEDFSNGWELEFASNEESEEDNSTKWVSESFNEMFEFIHSDDEDYIREHIDEYLNVERCIDTMLLINVIYGKDNASKNLLWTTYDGKRWACTPYDLDGTWGMEWNGNFGYGAELSLLNANEQNAVWSLLYKYFFAEVCTRYQELRKDILSEAAIKTYFDTFFEKVPAVVYQSEKNKWTKVPNQNINNEKQIITWAEKHFETIDKVFVMAEGETHQHYFDKKNTADDYLKCAATEDSNASYYYSCTCGQKSIISFEVK